MPERQVFKSIEQRLQQVSEREEGKHQRKRNDELQRKRNGMRGLLRGLLPGERRVDVLQQR
jgi:hypothetical protein